MSIHAPPTVLTFSASDPTGAGGVLADALTCASMGCHAACAITAVAVQDSTRVEDALLIDDEWLDDQARAVLQDMPVAAIKVGAVGGSDNAQAIAEILADYPELPVVFDPLPAVRASSSGSEEQADAELMTVLRELIVPQSTVMTLSLEQARRWLALAADDDAPEDWDAARCARELLEWGPEFVLITSAETVGNLIVNRLFGPENSVQSESIEHVDLRFRGAGDTLSAAIAALLAQGIEVGDAVREANDFLSQSLAGGFRLGMGDAMPDRLFWASDDGSDEGSNEASNEGGSGDGDAARDADAEGADKPTAPRH
jgi:hydroxymethylpyrimidine/phosphomethylpyrimidine kinase